MTYPSSVRTPYSGTRSIHLLEESPLDLAPRRLIAPRRRLRELTTDHTIYSPPNLLLNNEMSDDVNSGVIVPSIISDAEQPESPPVNNN